VAFEWKMDGARVQAHKMADDVRIYTRGLNEVTSACRKSRRRCVDSPHASSCSMARRLHSTHRSGRILSDHMRRFGAKLNVESRAPTADQSAIL